MRRLSLVQSTALATLFCAGILAGCGDNLAKVSQTGGTGGSAGDGGMDRADATGDATDGGPVSCTGISFVDPATDTTLGAADDSSGDNCGNGFQYTVVAGVTGSGNVELIATSGATQTSLGTALGTNGQARFTNVTIPQGASTLSLKVGATTCTPLRMVTVDCTLPAVTVVAPAGDVAPFADVSKRLLSATSTQDFKDANAATAGAQTDVVACTNKTGSAKLFAGQMGDAMLTQVGAAVNTVAAVPADQCPTGLSFVAKFPGVTLPESTENADGTLSKATELSVSVTDAVTPPVTTSSNAVDVWVDSAAPTLSEKTPTPFCGTTQAAPATFVTNVVLNSTTANVMLSVANGAATPVNYGPPAFAANAVTFTGVSFPQNLNTIVATATEPSGNLATLAPPAGMTTCTLNVGSAPVVTLVSPVPGSKLCAVGNSANGCSPDSNLAVPGWQNPITIHVATAAGAAVTSGNVNIVINMGAPQVVTLDASGNATLAVATIPEGTAVPVTITTTNAPPVGTVTHIFQVDTLPPAVPTDLTVVPLDRRQTSFTLGWTAPQDQGQPTVADYDIHVKAYNPTTMTCGTEVKAVPFPALPGPKAAMMPETIPVTGLSIETDYCFTVAATDAVGNAGSVGTTMGRANFNTTLLTGTGTEGFGSIIDGTGDFGTSGANGFTNDRLSDLLVGPFNGQNAYLFFGRSSGYPTAPDVTFTGPALRRFGAGIVAAGDLDGDGLEDIAIGAPGLTAADPAAVYIFSRKNAPWAVSGGWPATIDYTQASYVITPGPTYVASFFGLTMARLGNFDGAGRDDLAISAYGYDMATGTNAGRVVIVRGSDAFASLTLPDAVNTIVIDGEAASDNFGRAVEVLSDNTLVVSAYLSSAMSGKLYAFRMPLAPVTLASMTTAADITKFGSGNAQYGFAIGTLGPLGSASTTVTASATGPAGNFVDLHMSAVSDDVFGGASGSAPMPTVRFTSSTTVNSLGVVDLGGRLSGSSAMGSIIGGDAIPDLVIAGQGDPTNSIFIVSGAAITGLMGTVDLATSTNAGVVTLRNKLPTGWNGYNRSGLVLDLNGDGYADFALGEFVFGMPGRALVVW